MSNGTAAPSFPGLIDMHAHPGMNAYFWGRDLRKHYFAGSTFNPLASLTDFEMLRKGDVRVVWSISHVPEQEYFRNPPIRLLAHLTPGGRKMLKHDAWEITLRMMDAMEQQVARADDEFAFARSNAELDAALAAGKRVFVHTIEGGHQISAGLPEGDVQGRLDRLEQLAERGLASLILAHLFPNDIAGHSECIPAKQHKILFWKLDTRVDDSRGLTETGRAVVKRMAELRIIPDLTHCSPASRRDVYDLVGNEIPIVATHIGVQALNPVPVNMSEEDVKAIAASGGAVGVIFMPYWLEASHPGPGLEAIWRTMAQINEWSGGEWQHVGIGTDFDGWTDPPDDCKSAGELPRVREMLESKGLGRPEVEAVLGSNARRVLRDGWR
ncbi:MAG TPA: membrane dipeptidase [Solirubrobacterales bacterium]|jgi:membrane dipeptidase|nr:membrane dipeptidase [Solirubrobacterales bacterium]